ncbi:MAG TPA: Swt1 family HEPN domain-containing protein [Planctomycetaceae bacterium]|nr:Swt1 family HEPN domain-containing protein [Planctomycetaceae bacterium]
MRTPHETISAALEILTDGLGPFFQVEMCRVYGYRWEQTLRSTLRNTLQARSEPVVWDAYNLLTAMWEQWNEVVRQQLGLFERSLVSELREYRNLWAHQAAFTEDDAFRVLDTVQRLLAAVDVAPELLDRLEQLKFDVLREKLSRQIDEDRLRAEANREKVTEIALYGVGGATIIVTTLVSLVPRNPLAGGILCAFTVFTFVYLALKRWAAAAPQWGVHECRACRKIIYTEVCPYCEARPQSSVAKGSSASRLQTIRSVAMATLTGQSTPAKLTSNGADRPS